MSELYTYTVPTEAPAVVPTTPGKTIEVEGYLDYLSEDDWIRRWECVDPAQIAMLAELSYRPILLDDDLLDLITDAVQEGLTVVVRPGDLAETEGGGA